MSEISLSKAVRSNLLSLQNTAELMSKTQNRLATGNKVNSALDNPTNFFTASSLNSRAGDLNQLLDGMANGIQTIEAADNGLTAITKTLESMQSTLRQARQDKSFQTQSLTLDPTTIDTSAIQNLSFSGGAIDGIVEIALNTADDVPVQSTAIGTGFTAPIAGSAPTDLDSNSAVTALEEGGSFAFTVNGVSFTVTNGTAADWTETETATAIADAVNASTDPALTGITVTADAGELSFENETPGGEIVLGGADVAELGFNVGNRSSTDGVAPESFTLTIAGQSITLDSTNASDATAAAATIDAAISAAGFSAVADGGNIRVNGPADGSASVTIAGSSDALTAIFGSATAPTITPGSSGEGEVSSVNDLVNTINNTAELQGKIRASNDNGRLRIENLSTQTLDIDGVSENGTIDGLSTDANTIGGNTVRAELADQFRDLRDQLDKIADDASFNGINLLRGDNLQITFNETGTSEINIRSRDEQGINSTVLGIETNLEAADLDADANIDLLLADVKQAINQVRSQASSFGSSLSVVQNRQDFSKNMINTLQTGAANLTLADSNQEAANLLALQTRQQLSSTALSMASQADQAVLRLF